MNLQNEGSAVLKRNFGLDLVRFWAIALVLSVHLISNLVTNNIYIFWYLAYLGVEIFFVLSGYLIGGLILDSLAQPQGFDFNSLKVFLFRRWFRTVPLYFLALILNFFVGFFLLGNVQTLPLPYFFWVQNAFSPPPAFFGESWSLAIEEWFYILFALGFYATLKLGRLFSCKPMQSPAFFLAFYLFATNAVRYFFFKEGNALNNIAAARLDSIGYGFLAVFCQRELGRTTIAKYRLYIITAGLVLVPLSSIIFLKNLFQIFTPIVYYPMLGVGIALCIIFLESKTVWKVQGNISRLVVWGSKISYSLYLNNLLIIFLVQRYFDFSPAINLLAALSFIIVFSVFTHSSVEQVFFKIRDQFYPRRTIAKTRSNQSVKMST